MKENSFLLLRNIIEGKSDYEEISSDFKVIIEKLYEKELIRLEKSSYVATDKGLSVMEKYKVSNAIIMAAGFGSRFIPYTYTLPKGLLEVDGEVLIERQIKQLHEVGIFDITLVVGYLKEKFEYLIEKYNVKLIENNEYSIKNNISSIFYAGKENLLKNSYILTSDIRMSVNVYHAYEYDSWYALRYFEGVTDEWPVELDENKRITKLSTNGSDSLCLYGPAYFSNSYSKNLYSKIKEIYNDPTKSNYYWEDVYSDNIDEFDMYGNILGKDVVDEFESFEELIQYDVSYNSDPRNAVIETICRVMSVNPVDIKSIVSLKIGMTNDSFSFKIGEEKFVYRMPGEGTELLINRHNEAKVYEAIKHLKLSDEIVYLSPEDGTKISKFIVDSKMIDISYLKEMIKILKSLHNSGIVVDHSFDIIERVEYYKSLCEGVNSVYFDGYEEVYSEMNVLKEYIKDNPVDYVFCHIDGLVVNFLDTKGGLRLLDWEYSGMSDHFMDLAMNVLYSYLTLEEADNLLEDYLETKPSLSDYKRYYALIGLTGMLWGLWTVYKEALGDEFGSYGQEQFDYGKLYLEKFKSIGVENNETE